MKGCVNNGRTRRVCLDGRRYDMTCAMEERCQLNGAGDPVRIFSGSNPDGGSQMCVPGCAGAGTVRRCINGEPFDIACSATQTCVAGNCVEGGVDAGGSSGAPCTNMCANETTLLACTGTGATIMVTCNADSPCQNGRCTPPENPPGEEGGGTCACPGVSSLGSLAFVGVLLRWRRRSKPGHS
jgi:hypothetical protein